MVEYREGETVQAYVSPESPGQAFIKKEKTNTPYIFIALGSIFAAFGAYMALKP